MKKRILLGVVGALMSVVMLASCGGGSGSGGSSAKKTEGADYTIKDEVVYDDDKCKFTIKSIDPKGFVGPDVLVDCENKTEDKVIFGWETVSVNGYMVNPMLFAEVPGGTTQAESVSIYQSDLDKIGIGSIDELTFRLTAYPDGEYDRANYYVDKDFTVYPTGKDAGSIEKIEREAGKNDEVVYDENGIKIVATGYNPKNQYDEKALEFYIENNSEEYYAITFSDVILNGDKSYDGGGYPSVAPGKKAYAAITFYELDKAGVTDISSVKFSYAIRPYFDILVDNVAQGEYEYKIK